MVMTGRDKEGIALSRESQRSQGGAKPFSYLAEISGYGNLGEIDLAREALCRLEVVQPDISMTFIRLALPILVSDARARFFRGLVAAGLKEAPGV